MAGARRWGALGGLRLSHPLPAGSFAVSSPYGWRVQPQGVYNAGKRVFHNGLDFSASEGTPVYAAAAGVVARVDQAGVGAGVYNGNALVINHLDTHIASTAYLHLSQLAVRAGQAVRTGQIVGRVGKTGASTGPHLHFIVTLRDGQTTDPDPLLRPPTDLPEEARPLSVRASAQAASQSAHGAASAWIGPRVAAFRSLPAPIRWAIGAASGILVGGVAYLLWPRPHPAAAPVPNPRRRRRRV